MSALTIAASDCCSVSVQLASASLQSALESLPAAQSAALVWSQQQAV